MGSLVDAFAAEDRVSVKFSDFYALMKGCTERDLLMNGTRCNVPHQYMREMITGIKEMDTVRLTCNGKPLDMAMEDMEVKNNAKTETK